jgi:hypothetical protein
VPLPQHVKHQTRSVNHQTQQQQQQQQQGVGPIARLVGQRHHQTGAAHPLQRRRRRNPELCAALEEVLPTEACAVDADCWGFTCQKVVFGVPMKFACELGPICDTGAPGAAVDLAVQAPESGEGPWAFGMSEEQPNLLEEMAGLGFPNLPSCDIDVQAFAAGQLLVTTADGGTRPPTNVSGSQRSSARRLVDLNLGVDACCLDGTVPPICGSAARLFPETGWTYDFS